jgi:hypothetical protein
MTSNHWGICQESKWPEMLNQCQNFVMLMMCFYFARPSFMK